MKKWLQRVGPVIALLGGVLLSGAAQQPAAPDKQYVYPFGMCSNGNSYTNPDYPVKMVDTGARMCRLDLAFSAVRPQPEADPDKWDWKRMDTIRRLKKQHPNLDYLMILGYGVAWAEDPRFKSVPAEAIASPQANIGVMPAESPRNLFGHYVYETVRRYKDVVRYWESWNEPDLPNHAFFKGNGKDFFPYQKACYLAAKKADPDCTVLFAGLCYPTIEGYLAAHGLHAPSPYPAKSSFFEEYLEECAKDPEAKKNNYYFDVMNQHSYSRASDLYDYTQVLRKLMRDYLKEEKPIWITEMGIPDQGGMFGCTPDEYCDYQLQAFAWGRLAGVEKFFHFQLDNSNGLGLYGNTLSEPKPALVTYRDVLVKELADSLPPKQLHGTPGVGFLKGGTPFKSGWQAGYNLFEFQSFKGNRRILMAFADTDKEVRIKIPARKDEAVLVDRHNRRSVLRAHEGTYAITLKRATNRAGWPSGDDPKGKALGNPEHLIGGATVLVIE